MPSVDYERRRFQGLRTPPSRNRTTLQVIVAVLAVAAIALAFVLRPGQGGNQVAPSAAGSASTPTLAPRATPSTPAKAAAPAAPTSAAAPAPTAAPAAPAGEQTHVVAQGDTLSTIAQRYYGDASKWDKIFQANRDQLPDAGSLKLGQKLKIPN